MTTTALLLSGGMDSCALAYWRRPDLAITVDYGQKPAPGEIRSASAICSALQVKHVVVTSDISQLGSGDLAGLDAATHAPASEWWPYRNQFLCTLAGMKCQQVGASRLLIGALKTDGFHADGRPEFVQQMNTLFALQEGELVLEAPAHHLSAAELVVQSGISRDILAWSHSCHVSEHACGFCRGCRKHFETMEAVFGEPY
ncbi:MAG: 7-cyano-7-deazaguanine synthase [Caulobacteraceae bacterium]